MIKILSTFEIKSNKKLYRLLNDKRRFNLVNEQASLDTIDLILIDLDKSHDSPENLINGFKAQSDFNGYFVLFSEELSRDVINAYSDFYVLKIVNSHCETKDYKKHFDAIIHSYYQRIYLKKSKIAIVDDDALQLNLMVDILNRYGLTQVDTYSDYKSFKSKMFDYDIYLIDMVLPDIYGEEIIIRIRNKKPKALIIAVSSLEKVETITSVLYNGADDYYTKPTYHKLIISKIYSNFRYQRLLIQNEANEKRLEKLAIRDGLTGLYNHKYMYDKLKSLIKVHKRSGDDLSLIMSDIDDFKKINDTYGHVKGDEVLKKIASIYKENSREGEVAGRYGGEEFLLLLPRTSKESAVKAAERLRKKIENSSCGDITFTASFGVYTSSGENAETLVSKADACLYQAKNQGKNKVVY